MPHLPVDALRVAHSLQGSQVAAALASPLGWGLSHAEAEQRRQRWGANAFGEGGGLRQRLPRRWASIGCKSSMPTRMSQLPDPQSLAELADTFERLQRQRRDPEEDAHRRGLGQAVVRLACMTVLALLANCS